MKQLREVSRPEFLSAVRNPFWHMLGAESQIIVSQVNAAPVSMMYDDDDEEGGASYEINADGVALFSICGPLVHSEFQWWFPYVGYVSLPKLARDFYAASEDENVKNVYIYAKCPGGHVMGLYSACQALTAIRAAGKRVYVAASMACSAMYEIASQADKIYLSPDGLAGCIGTMSESEDWSKYYRQLGVEVFISASDGAETYKGEGARGAPITNAQRADFKRMCNEYRTLFNGVILAGRPSLSKTLPALADGRTHIGSNALALGLVDAIATPEQVLAALGGGDAIEEPEYQPPPDTDPDDLPDDTPQDRRRAPPIQNLQSRQPVSATGIPVAVAISPVTPPQGRKDAPMSFKEKFVNALTVVGLGGMAVNVLAKDSEDPDAIARSVANDVEGAVQQRLASDPMTLANNAAGIHTPADLAAVLELKAIGLEALTEMRNEAIFEATRAYGAEQGPVIGSTVNSQKYAQVKSQRDGWRTMADANARITENGGGAERQTQARAGAALNADLADKPEPKTKWEQLTPEQKAHGVKMGNATPEKQEAFASNVLAMGVN